MSIRSEWIAAFKAAEKDSGQSDNTVTGNDNLQTGPKTVSAQPAETSDSIDRTALRMQVHRQAAQRVSEAHSSASSAFSNGEIIWEVCHGGGPVQVVTVLGRTYHILEIQDRMNGGETTNPIPDSCYVNGHLDKDMLLYEINLRYRLWDYPRSKRILASGECGKNLLWTLEDHILTVEGNGPMYDRSLVLLRESFLNSIKVVLISSGVTSISKKAFRYCDNVETVLVPASVTSIHEEAFADCKKLSDIYFLGTAKQWDAVRIDNGNDCLKTAKVHYSK